MSKNKKKKCNFCNISFKNLGGHQRFCKAKKESEINQQAETPVWNPLAQKLHETERELSNIKHLLNRAQLTLNGYRETLGAAGRLLASLVDVSEIN